MEFRKNQQCKKSNEYPFLLNFVGMIAYGLKFQKAVDNLVLSLPNMFNLIQDR
jgi:hypothetical protein